MRLRVPTTLAGPASETTPLRPTAREPDGQALQQTYGVLGAHSNNLNPSHTGFFQALAPWIK